MTTILMFLDSQLAVPAHWFDTGWATAYLGVITFGELTLRGQRGFKNFAIPFSEARLPTMEMEQMVFDLVNFGGVPQGGSD